MLVYAVDVGTTNLKVVLYDETLRRLGTATAPARYHREGVRVEFDPEQMFRTVLDLIGRCGDSAGDRAGEAAVVAVTGQAESLVLLDGHGEPVRPAISWLDDRAAGEAAELAERFDPDEAFAITGEPAPTSTWPAAKLRWLRRHEPEALEQTRAVLMIKDDLVRRLTGLAHGEVTTRGFTYWWDVATGAYWPEMLDHCGVPEGSLPDVVPAGTEVGPVTDAVRDLLPPAAGYRVNVAALDHFCAMVGTGSYGPDVVSESAGTVLSLSMLARDWAFDAGRKVSFHAGIRPGDVVLFTCVDAGGAALEWYRVEGLAGMSYARLEAELGCRDHRGAPMFLPYLTGVNPPDFFPAAKAAFLDLDLGHDRVDLAYAVEEGVAHLLRRNVEYLSTQAVRAIVSTGGGAASPFWNQLKADVCDLEVVVPDELEATCRGAAVLALVGAGALGRLEDGREVNAPSSVRYRPTKAGERQSRYERFDAYLRRLYDTPTGR